VHQPKSHLERLYVKRKEGGRGLVKDEAANKADITSIAKKLIMK
jgi:hypothetical protein